MSNLKSENTYEIVIAIVLSLLVISFMDPFMILMPSKLSMMILLFALIAFFIFTVFLWRERALDEREEYHRLVASRIGFFAGAVVIMIGLVIQGLNHAVDPWLVYALLAMVIAKVIARIYGRSKN